MTNKNKTSVIFDLGNVILFFDVSIICKQVADLYNIDEKFVLQKIIKDGLETEFEQGKLTPESFTERCSEALGVSLELPVFKDAWTYMFTENTAVIEMILELKSKVRLLLMSNTNIWHIEHIKRDFSVLQLLDDLILSYEVGYTKPQSGIYQRAAELTSDSELTVFIDDIDRYAAAANEFGIHGIHYTSPEALRAELTNLGIL